MADIHGGAFSDEVHAELHSMPRNMRVQQIDLTVSEDFFEKRVQQVETSLGIAFCKLNPNPIPMIRTVNDEDDEGVQSGPSGRSPPDRSLLAFEVLTCTGMRHVYFVAASHEYPGFLEAIGHLNRAGFDEKKAALDWALELHTNLVGPWWPGLCAACEETFAEPAKTLHQPPVFHRFADRCLEWDASEFLNMFCMLFSLRQKCYALYSFLYTTKSPV